MRVDEILHGFEILFPEWMDSVTGYKRFGSKSIILYFREKSLVFYFNNTEDWTFGTKAFRRVPDNVKSCHEETEVKTYD